MAASDTLPKLSNGTSLDPNPSSGLGKNKAALLPQPDRTEPPACGWDIGHLGAIFQYYYNKSYFYSSSFHACVPEMLFSWLCGRSLFPSATTWRNTVYRWYIIELYTWNVYNFINQYHPNKYIIKIMVHILLMLSDITCKQTVFECKIHIVFFKFFIVFRERKEEREKHQFVFPLMHFWLILVYALTRDRTCNLCMSEWCPNQLSSPARATVCFSNSETECYKF